jgi:copper chaperone CopZ
MLKSVTFEVIGEQQIYCESCENRIERLLKGVQGVEQVRAQSKNQRIEVLFDVAVLEPTAIAERLEKAGYRTTLATPTPESLR